MCSLHLIKEQDYSNMSITILYLQHVRHVREAEQAQKGSVLHEEVIQIDQYKLCTHLIQVCIQMHKQAMGCISRYINYLQILLYCQCPLHVLPNCPIILWEGLIKGCQHNFVFAHTSALMGRDCYQDPPPQPPQLHTLTILVNNAHF